MESSDSISDDYPSRKSSESIGGKRGTVSEDGGDNSTSKQSTENGNNDASNSNNDASNSTAPAANESSSVSKNPNDSLDGISNKTDEGEKKLGKNEKQASAAVNSSTNATGSKDVTTRMQTTDPYLSIGSDSSSNHQQPITHLKPKVSEWHSSDHSNDAIADFSPKSVTANVHNDIVMTNQAAKDTAKKGHISKKSKDADILNLPVSSMVKTILDKAAKHAVHDFTKTTGLKNVAKLLVKAAVHNALRKRPEFVKAFKDKAKKSKKSKKKSHAETRSPIPHGTNGTKKDLMEFGNDKASSVEPAVGAAVGVIEPSVIED